MLKRKLVLIVPILVLFLSASTLAVAQENSDTILNNYTQALDLDENQSQQFEKILTQYQNQLQDATLSSKEFNTIMKKRDLAFFDILSKEQFKLYKENILVCEPNLRYRFKKKQ